MLIFSATLFAQDYNKADSLINLLEREQHDTSRVILYSQLAREYRAVDIDSAHYYANEGLLLAKEVNFSHGLAESYACLGDIEVIRDNLDLAREHYLKSLNFFRIVNRRGDLTQVCLVLGNIYLAQDNYFNALNYYNEGVKIAEEIDFKAALEYLYTNLGEVYNKIENTEKALEFLQKALEVSKESDHKENIASIFDNMGNIYFTQNDFQIAKTYYEKSRILAIETNNKALESSTLISIGEVYEWEKQYDIALDYFEKSLVTASQIDDKYLGPRSILFAKSYSQIGSIYYFQKNYQKAIDFLNKGYKLAQETGQLALVSKNAEKLSLVYEALNQHKVSLKYARIFKDISDSILNEDIVKKTTQLEMQFKFDKEIRERELEQTKKEALQKRKELVYIMIAAGSILGLMLVVLLYLLLKSKVKRVELSEKNLQLEKITLVNELEYKNKELTTNVMYLLKKNELIVNIIEKLKIAKLEFKPENRKIADDIIRELESSSTKDTWKEFELRFMDVHSDFYDKLNNLFPDLSPNELKLCAFLRLNMSTKEIASITYLSVNSINIARHRLRKKLNIDQEENLITYLSQL